jgi:hypothetical protein
MTAGAPPPMTRALVRRRLGGALARLTALWRRAPRTASTVFLSACEGQVRRDVWKWLRKSLARCIFGHGHADPQPLDVVLVEARVRLVDVRAALVGQPRAEGGHPALARDNPATYGLRRKSGLNQ